MEIVDFKADHLFQLDLQDAQQYLGVYIQRDQATALEQTPSFTGVEGDAIVGCAGIIPMWHGRAMAWAYLSSLAVGPTFLSVHRAVKRFLDVCYVQRIEMTVDCDFEQGHRWAMMLGFVKEANCMRAYRPDGGDCALYARILV